MGCEEYRDVQSNQRYLKSFSSLCPQDKVGCEAFLQTNNSVAPWQETYNALCVYDPNNDGVADTCDLELGCLCSADGRDKCTIVRGQTSCRYDEKYFDVPNARQDISTQKVVTDTVVYLLNDPTKYCQNTVKGCSELGLPLISQTKNGDDQTVLSTSTVTYVNDPDRYVESLCLKDLEACEVYSNNGSPYYFKNPRDRVCTRKLLPGAAQEAWYKKNKECLRANGANTGLVCYGSEEEATCAEEFDGTCEEIACPIQLDFASAVKNQPVDESILATYMKSEGICIVRNFPVPVGCTTNADCSDLGGNCQLKWTYECPAGDNGCTSFQDSIDDYQAYMRLDNQEIERKECNGLVSQKTGCILFHNPNIMETQTGPTPSYYSSLATYQFSEVQNESGEVSPVDCSLRTDITQAYCKPVLDKYIEPGVCSGGDRNGFVCRTDSECSGGGGVCDLAPWGVCRFSLFLGANGTPCSDDSSCGPNGLCMYENDSNDIVQVRRDRVCGESLECISQSRTLNESTGVEEQVCTKFQRCSGLQEGGSLRCEEFISDFCNNDIDCKEDFGPESVCDVATKKCSQHILNADFYKDRDTSYAGDDYSGYSLPNKYLIDQYAMVPEGRCLLDEDIELDENGNFVEIQYDPPKDIGPCLSQEECRGECIFPEDDLRYRLTFLNANGDSVGIDGQSNAPENSHINDVKPSVVPDSCRLYPEDNSPFDAALVNTDNPRFQEANKCGEDPTSFACECTYTIKSTGGQPLYVESENSEKLFEEEVPLTGICTVADEEAKYGMPCNENADCRAIRNNTNSPAQCGNFNKTTRHIGWKGFCLEKDLARPTGGAAFPDDFSCLTWYPVGLIAVRLI